MNVLPVPLGLDARSRFSPAGTYLNTATYGLPPREAFAALQRAADEWRHGRCGFDGWDRSVGRAREAFARLAGVHAGDVAVGGQVSPFVGLVAAALPRGARVLCAEGDFTSLLWPFLAQADRGVEVRQVALRDLPEAIEAGTDLVACSAVQSACGSVLDLDALSDAATHHGVRTLLDTTQAMGWLPLDASRFDVTVCGGYKWLLNPRGTAFMTLRGGIADELVPHAAGWYAGEDVMESLYDGPLRLAGDARRFDISPAWLSWVGAAPALELIDDIGVERIHEHDLSLADRFREELGLAPTGSAIVSLEADPATIDRLRSAGVMASARAGRIRLAFHLYNDEDDVDAALDALTT